MSPKCCQLKSWHIATLSQQTFLLNTLGTVSAMCQVYRGTLGKTNRWFALWSVYQDNVMPEFCFFFFQSPAMFHSSALWGVSYTHYCLCIPPLFSVWIQYLLSQLESSGMHRLQLMGCGNYRAACWQHKWGKNVKLYFLKTCFLEEKWCGSACDWNSNFLYSLHSRREIQGIFALVYYS